MIGRRRDDDAQERPGFWATLRQIRDALLPIGRFRVLAAFLTVGAAAAVVLGVLSFGAMTFTSRSEFCGNCHSMDPFYEGWQTASHSDVKCTKCHMRPGVFGYIAGKINGMQEVISELQGGHEAWAFNAVVGNANCLQCHADIMEELIVTDGPVPTQVSHEHIVETGGKCLFCHSTVGHGEATAYGSQTTPDMQTCFRCHDGEVAPLTCSTCHVERPPDPGEDVHTAEVVRRPRNALGG